MRLEQRHDECDDAFVLRCLSEWMLTAMDADHARRQYLNAAEDRARKMAVVGSTLERKIDDPGLLGQV